MTTNFDRAASFYDKTRGLPQTAMAELTNRLAEGLGAAESVLELGVGTGRVAVPLSERGFVMTGIDVSEKMLAVLGGKASDVDAQVASAIDLPFGDASFDAILAVDFFHLVAEWRRSIAQAVRVLRPGGRIVLSTFEVLDDPTTELRRRIFRHTGTKPRRIGAELDHVVHYLKHNHNATVTELAPIPYVMPTSIAAELDGLRAGTWSRYWELPDNLRNSVANQLDVELRDARTALNEPLEIKISQTVWVAAIEDEKIGRELSRR